MNPEGKIVILTGASAGIGRAAAYVLAQAGCRLALAARRADVLADIVADLRGLGTEVEAFPTDMGDTRQAAALVHRTVEKFGGLDVVINNAAVGLSSPIAEMDETLARQMMDVNYFGPIALIQAAVPYLKKNSDGGLIINISSIVGRRAVPGIGNYCASKAALERMAESLRVELAADNIRVSTVYPGVTQTDFVRNSLGNPAGRQHRMRGVPPERVA
ncbi:MAG: SDR family NAD(P)-dependent oxidoreductase, partial [Chloroflexi bacterium]